MPTANGHCQLPSLHDMKNLLPGGKIRNKNGRQIVEFQDPWTPQEGRRPCAFWLVPDAPYEPWRVSSLKPEHDPIQLKDKVRELAPGLGSFAPHTARKKHNGNGKAQRSAGGPGVREVEEDSSSAPQGKSGQNDFALPDLPPCSDETLALEFARRYQHKLCYTHKWGKWHVYDERRWREDDTLYAFDQARVICREAATSAPPKEKKDTASAKKRVAVASLAREDRRLAKSSEDWDRDVWLLNTPDGTFDLQAFAMREHRATDRITRITSAPPGGECPRWSQFLKEITGEDTEFQSFLQRVCGYVLSGDVSEHALFFLYGTGANGKSVFLNTLAHIMGDYHRVAPIETFTASKNDRHPTEIAMLRGARLVTAVETEDGRRWAESRIKTLTGGDPISARFMKQDFFEFRPTFKLIIAGNHKPSLRTVDEAMRRRLHLLPFNRKILPDARDPDLTAKLAQEASGILRWAMEGFAEWRDTGLQPPKAVTEATDAYLQAEDALSNWMNERCERKGEEQSSKLYADWRIWCTLNGEEERSNKWFTQRLEERGLASRRTRGGSKIVGLYLLSG